MRTPHPVWRLRGDSPQTIADVVEVARSGGFDDEDVALLAERLASSGACLHRIPHSADLASTGGPSSLSTLLGPLYLRVLGYVVPKLGVPGRPAGGVDVLATVPGFITELEPHRVEIAVKQHGYVHLLADDRWTPLDRTLFRYRQEHDAQTIPELVTASLLAKKLAAGLERVGLEVRVAPHGNFGSDRERARTNAHLFNRVARLLDLEPCCLLTDASRPYQPHIGRGEALAAMLDVLDGLPDPWLAEHAELCRQMSVEVAEASAMPAPHPGALLEAQEECLTAHGTSMKAVRERVECVRAAPRTEICAEVDGIVDYAMGRIRAILVEAQRSVAATSASFTDPAGVILLVRPGERVATGQPLMSVRPADADDLISRLRCCVAVDLSHGPASTTGMGAFAEVVRD